MIREQTASVVGHGGEAAKQNEQQEIQLRCARQVVPDFKDLECQSMEFGFRLVFHRKLSNMFSCILPRLGCGHMRIWKDKVFKIAEDR